MFVRELNNGVQELPGIGPATASALSNLGITSISDALVYAPRDFEDRKKRIALSSVGTDGTVNTIVTVVEHQYFNWGRRRTLKVIVTDDTAPASLVCFGRNFLAKKLIPGSTYYLYGRFTRRRGELQSSSFFFEPYSDNPRQFDIVLPVYGLTEGVTQRTIRAMVYRSLKKYGGSIENELPEAVREKREILSKSDALNLLHFPEEIEQSETARRTLAYEELFYLQLFMQHRARSFRTSGGPGRRLSTELADSIVSRLSFSLTGDQQHVLGEIREALESSQPMMRLLQGDVGCGKTLVAFLAAALVVAEGEQVAFMAPTELLARQHAETAAEILEPVGIRVGFLSGSVKSDGRTPLLDAVGRGEVDFVVGTHALFGRSIAFDHLALVIVDEQHRFGVMQRLAIVEKGDRPATPIPRSLALTVFGDLDTSTIRTMPPGRIPVITHLARIGNEKKVYDRVRREINAGRQAYFVYPLISQSGKLEVKDAEGAFEYLDDSVFPEFTLALIHSKIPEEEKREKMSSFAEGKVDILVATSVVEVGVNVPNATCMVIEHAERFGLAALHQLRGRVGRSDKQAYAFLIYAEDITDDAKRRLLIMKETNDGFRIAEEDLKMRGPGELTGLRQSGELSLNFADLIEDFDLLRDSREDVKELLDTDPGFLMPSNAPVREVLSRCPPFETTLTAAG